MEIINLRSDTQTLPTDEMLAAMRAAPLGDDIFDEDPTVQKLEAMAAGMMGMDAACLVISGTMGNLVSLMAHTTPGDEVLLDRESHIFYAEGGGLASVAGLMPMLLMSHDGLLVPKEIEAAIRKANIHYPTPRLLCLENTHSRSGGRVVPLDLHKELCQVAKAHGLAIHLDGARIFNASVALGVSPASFTEDVDSVMSCLSKGLSCPLGSVVVGNHDFIAQAEHARKRIGGGMRQAGIIAAAGIVALEKMTDRLAEDHVNAKILAAGINSISALEVNMEQVETNMVLVDHTGTGLSIEQLTALLRKAGVIVGARPPGHLRLVTNRHHTKVVIEEAVLRIKGALSTR